MGYQSARNSKKMTNPDREFFDDVTLQLNVKEFESLKQKAIEKGNKVNEEDNMTMDFNGLNFDVDNEEFIDGKIKICGSLKDPETKKDLGWMDVNVDLSLDRVLDLINFYMKKLGKLKTVLEATKD